MDQLHPNISYFYSTILQSVTATIGIAQSLRESHATLLIMLDNNLEHCQHILTVELGFLSQSSHLNVPDYEISHQEVTVL